MSAPLCPFCGAASIRQCDLEDEFVCCPWEESEPDPDQLRDDRDERRRLEKEYPDDQD